MEDSAYRRRDSNSSIPLQLKHLYMEKKDDLDAKSSQWPSHVLLRKNPSLWHTVVSMIDEVLARENNRTINTIRQSTMPTSNHHETNDEFAKGIKFPRQGGIDGGVAETEADIGTVKELA